MLKYKILNNTNIDKFIDIPINMNFDPMDNSEIVEELIRQEKRKSINIQKDLEIVRYSPVSNGISFIPHLAAYFYNCTLSNFNYNFNYNSTGFNTDGTSNDDRIKKVFSKSFYILDFYDSMDTRTQNKISSTIIFTVPPNPVNKLLLNSTFLSKVMISSLLTD
ncbi:MAG: hypothetical protein AABY22_35630, partial [Nanoarchaeota archaeon]